MLIMNAFDLQSLLFVVHDILDTWFRCESKDAGKAEKFESNCLHFHFQGNCYIFASTGSFTRIEQSWYIIVMDGPNDIFIYIDVHLDALI